MPRWLIEGETVTLPPTDMRYAKPEIAKSVFDANYEGGVNSLKRVAIELDEYNDYTLFKKPLPDGSVPPTLPDYNWNLTEAVQEVRLKEYDDSFDASDLDDDEEEEE